MPIWKDKPVDTDTLERISLILREKYGYAMKYICRIEDTYFTTIDINGKCTKTIRAHISFALLKIYIIHILQNKEDNNMKMRSYQHTMHN